LSGRAFDFEAVEVRGEVAKEAEDREEADEKMRVKTMQRSDWAAAWLVASMF